MWSDELVDSSPSKRIYMTNMLSRGNLLWVNLVMAENFGFGYAWIPRVIIQQIGPLT